MISSWVSVGFARPPLSGFSSQGEKEMEEKFALPSDGVARDFLIVVPRVGDDSRAYVTFAIGTPGAETTRGIALRPLPAIRIALTALKLSIAALLFKR